MLRFTQLNTFGMTYDMTYGLTLCVAPRGWAIYYLKGWKSEAVKWVCIYMRNDCSPFVLVVETSLKTWNYD